MKHAIGILFTAALLAGCGFELAGNRQADIAATTGIYFEGGTAEFRSLLRDTYRRAGVAMASSPDDAEQVITLIGPEERLHLLTVTEELDARDYEFEASLTVSTTDADGNTTSVKLSRYRNWQFNEMHYLASDEERRVIGAELQQELLDALLLWLKRIER